MMTYTQSVQDFYKGSYVPLNSDRIAVLYLFIANLKQISIN